MTYSYRIQRKTASLGLSGLFFLSLILLCSCGYRWGDYQREIPNNYQALAIPVFQNRTSEVGVEMAFTNALVRELERSGLAYVVPKNLAEASLEGTIDSITYVADNWIDGNRTRSLPRGTVLSTQYRINTQVSLRLRRATDGRILWQRSFSGERSYLAPRIGIEEISALNATYNHRARKENIQEMAADLMAKAYSRLTENF